MWQSHPCSHPVQPEPTVDEVSTDSTYHLISKSLKQNFLDSTLIIGMITTEGFKLNTQQSVHKHQEDIKFIWFT